MTHKWIVKLKHFTAKFTHKKCMQRTPFVSFYGGSVSDLSYDEISRKDLNKENS